jgi:galactokinase
VRSETQDLLERSFGPGGGIQEVAAPGRVNLIGEHIDYHGLPVLPIAIRRSVRVAFRPRTGKWVRAVSTGYGLREFEWTAAIAPVAAGDWENYVRAAARVARDLTASPHGIDAAIVSDLPAAAGLSSSTALLVALTLALLRANGREADFGELMEVLPDGEQFVGTRGGGMDHAASLGSKAGCASMIEFEPLRVRHVPVPAGWKFLAAHSLVTAEKAGGAREEYNQRRAAGTAALERLGFASYRAAIAEQTGAHLSALAYEKLPEGPERDAFLHVTSEALRVHAAVRAMERADAAAFGRLLLESHASLRDRLLVSCPELDWLVETAIESGADGARLTGAGFGGCALVFCRESALPAVRRGLIEHYYSTRPDFDESCHLIDADPGSGALHPC